MLEKTQTVVYKIQKHTKMLKLRQWALVNIECSSSSGSKAPLVQLKHVAYC